MTYISNWTSLGLDWSNPKSQEAKYMETLRQALLEKYQPISTFNPYTSMFTFVRTYSKFLDNLNSSNNVYDHTFCVEFDKTLVTLLQFYSTTSLTNFQGASEFTLRDNCALGVSYSSGGAPDNNPRRGMSRILDLLNTKVWISPPRKSCIESNLWLKQRYNMLNLLTQFVFYSCYGGGPSFSKEGYGQADTAQEAWDLAVSEFNMAPWVARSADASPVAQSQVVYDGNSGRYSAYLFTTKGKTIVREFSPYLDYSFIYNLAPIPYDYYVRVIGGSPRPSNYEIEPTSYNFSEFSVAKSAGSFTFLGLPDVYAFPNFKVPSVEYDLGTPHIPSTFPTPDSPYNTYGRYSQLRGCVVLNFPFRFSS